MQKSFFFRRVLMLLLIAIFMWTVMTALLYSFISRPIFTRIKVAELQPKAELIARLAAQNYQQSDTYFNTLLHSSFELFDSWIFVVDGLSNEVRNSSLPDDSVQYQPEIMDQISKNMPLLQSGEYTSLWFTERRSVLGEILYIGVPITLRFGFQSSVVGAVFFIKPLRELDAGLNSMNIALLISALIVLALMIIPAYIVTGRLVRPLRQTRDVAMAMAAGNFQVRADSGAKGEIGELALTMNNLAQELSQTISALTLERNRLKQVLDGMSDGLIAVDLVGEITQANQAVYNLLGIEPRLDGPADQADLFKIHDLASAFAETNRTHQPTSLTFPSGARIISIQITPLADSSSQFAGAVGLLRDITETEHLEQTRRDYVANVSHELRSPLTTMRALIEPLKDGMVTRDEDRVRYYGILLRETVRLSHLINDMLELSRLQTGNLAMLNEPFDLQDLLQEIEAKYRLRVSENGQALTLPANLAACPPVVGDPERVEQVLVILLDNALKFTAMDGHIQILLDWNPGQVLVSVQDDGMGIDPADLPYVFDRFFKADKSHHQPGTGLGLSIAREVLQRMGQSIHVRSKPGKGTVFTFTLARQSGSPVLPLV